ncbi:hypothetical protein F5Y15DRAFT_236889 [Xylariaceae sp. FL0016]|nr:hypothetical protein F5Y15DRAFT_236889 [Xylariaceae sp. FL0016]
MEGRPITADSKHTYPAHLWTRSTSSPAVPRLSTLPTTPAIANVDPSSPAQFASHLDLVPIYFPHQSSLYQAQLLQYNKLVAPGRGGGLHAPPLPPLLSSHSVHAGPTPRTLSSSKLSNKDSRGKQSSQNCHGNRGNQTFDKADRALIAGKNLSPNMPPKKSDLNQGLPQRPKVAASPSNIPPHPNSVPSTPHQHARKFSFESREQSPNANHGHSPRSVYSETNGAVPSLRPLPPPRQGGGCKYETGLKHVRRRMAYKIGSDPLPRTDLKTIKNRLSGDQEQKLTRDMHKLYEDLQPTDAVEVKRRALVNKLEKLLNDTWPGHDIRVHLFGSSGNLLCSDDSDVDICITTPWKELEGVCMLAELLARHGMEQVICVSSAKVPIVKIWDPELKLSCDMNVNNTLALENTRMIKTYVEIDDRVRPLAMVIKHWTRRRIVNDAAFGGTLSSYTWICMIVAFLQLRQPPVLPVLHQRPHQKLPKKDGEIAAFADDIDKLRGYGSKNKSSWGELLFQFFRFYAHEFDYGTHVLSVRLGKLLTKDDKKWRYALNNMLCVEEPFNTGRNLGNTADDTSFRGLHQELRRAFDLIADANLDECCQQYEYPKEEEKIFQKPPSVSRPVLIRSTSQQQGNRGGRGGNFRNGNRPSNLHRTNGNNNNNRRASAGVPYDPNANQMYIQAPYMMMPQDAAAMYMHTSPEVVAQTLSALQLQENSLRFLQYTQSQQFAQQQALHHAQRMQGNVSHSQPPTERSRTNSFDTPPLSAPLRPEMRPDIFYYPMHLQQAQAYYAQQGFGTYPSSPSNNHNAEYRRSSARSTTASDNSHSLNGSTLRSQSQPASRPVLSIPTAQGLGTSGQTAIGVPNIPARYVNGIPIPSFMADEGNDNEQENPLTASPPDEDKGQAYYTDPSSPPRRTSSSTNGLPAFGDIGPQSNSPNRRRLSSDHFPQSVLDRIKQSSRSPSPLGHSRRPSAAAGNPTPLASGTVSGGLLPRETGPLVVNGSVSKPPNGNSARLPWQLEYPSSESAAFDNPLHISQKSDLSVSGPSIMSDKSPLTKKSTSPASERPVVVNGSSNSPALSIPPFRGPHFSNDIMSVGPNGNMGIPEYGPSIHNAATRSPIGNERLPRFLPNSLAQLDLATESAMQTNELQHLSPVYEANSPSPSFTRRLELPVNQGSARAAPANRGRSGTKPDSTTKGKQKLTADASSPKADIQNHSNPKVNGLRENGHVRGAKSESDNSNDSTGWHKIPHGRGRKKGSDGKGRGSETYPQSEQIPKNESERKGG